MEVDTTDAAGGGIVLVRSAAPGMALSWPISTSVQARLVTLCRKAGLSQDATLARTDRERSNVARLRGRHAVYPVCCGHP